MHFDYSHGFDNDFFVAPEFGADIMSNGMAVVGVFATIFFVIYALAVAFSIACYVFQSVGLYAVAKRRGIYNPWLAWIPAGNMWILGSISDQYQYVAKGKVKNRRGVLLGLMIAAAAMPLVTVVTVLMGGVGAPIITFLLVLLYLLLIAAGIALTVLQYMAMYDLYRSCEPDNAVVYLVLSILFNVAQPFIVFACRKKDLGMPERKPAAQPELVEAPAEAARDEVTEEDFAEE